MVSAEFELLSWTGAWQARSGSSTHSSLNALLTLQAAATEICGILTVRNSTCSSSGLGAVIKMPVKRKRARKDCMCRCRCHPGRGSTHVVADDSSQISRKLSNMLFATGCSFAAQVRTAEADDADTLHGLAKDVQHMQHLLRNASDVAGSLAGMEVSGDSCDTYVC